MNLAFFVTIARSRLIKVSKHIRIFQPGKPLVPFNGSLDFEIDVALNLIGIVQDQAGVVRNRLGFGVRLFLIWLGTPNEDLD